ncbi:hypothetical protein FB451DRAFT_1171597 [Mycena latifolia]|nr:hypothetical protein FB451DRAFT_1171597 [Mycena latifolia]
MHTISTKLPKMPLSTSSTRAVLTTSEARTLMRAHIFHSGDVDRAPCRIPSEHYNHLAHDTGMRRTLQRRGDRAGLTRRAHPARFPPPQLPGTAPARLGAAVVVHGFPP